MTVLHGKDPNRYTVTGLCRLFGVSKQAYYKTLSQPYAIAHETEVEIVAFVIGERKLDIRMGCRKLWLLYNREHGHVSRSVFEDVMTAYHLWLRNKRHSTRTTNSVHGLPVYPNLIYSVIADHPCQIWVSDITYIRLANPDGTSRFCYLSLVTDVYSRYILGYYIGRTLETFYTTVALTMALETCTRVKLDITGLIHHSDRGVQYASADYVNILKDNHILISMTEGGNPKDNSQAERINSTIKNELLGGETFRSIEEVMSVLPSRIEYYNNRRPHMSIDNMTPAEALGRCGEIRKRWFSYRDAAIKKLSL